MICYSVWDRAAKATWRYCCNASIAPTTGNRWIGSPWPGGRNAPRRCYSWSSSTLADVPAGSGAFAGDHQIFGPGPVATDPRTVQSLCRLAAMLSQRNLNQFLPQALPGLDLLALKQSPPPRLLLLGAGPDAHPVAELAAFLGWNFTVIDHRSQYARAERFPNASAVLDGGPPALAALLSTDPADARVSDSPPAAFGAAIVMSHHLATDRAYLRALARSDIPYVGLLGPAVRRERLLAELGADAKGLRARLRSPVGLDLGAETPEAIALSIMAEIHAAQSGRARAEPLARLAAVHPESAGPGGASATQSEGKAHN